MQLIAKMASHQRIMPGAPGGFIESVAVTVGVGGQLLGEFGGPVGFGPTGILTPHPIASVGLPGPDVNDISGFLIEIGLAVSSIPARA